MLFVTLCKPLPGTEGERVRRRMELGYAENGPVVAEYWLESTDLAGIVICKADHIGQLWTMFGGWGDLFEMTIVPAIEAREGLELLKQMIGEAQA
jgi:hypothetical protein